MRTLAKVWRAFGGFRTEEKRGISTKVPARSGELLRLDAGGFDDFGPFLGFYFGFAGATASGSAG
jgi:hypothetical protein